MIEKLKECQKKEQEGSHEKHCTMEDMSYAVAPLYKRGLIDIRESVVDTKTLHCIFLTKAGKDYLRNLKN
jgi:DNA-binding MarR family transcriptional regulator